MRRILFIPFLIGGSVYAAQKSRTFIWGNGYYQAIPGQGLSFSNFIPKEISNIPSSLKAIFLGERFEGGIDEYAYIWDTHKLCSSLEEGDDQRKNIVKLDNSKGVVEIRFTKQFIWTLNSKGEVYQYPITDGKLQNQAKKVQSLKNVKQIAAGEDHLVILNNNGEVFTMGDDTLGQCGLGQAKRSTAPPFYESRIRTPHKVDLPPINKIACGSNHTIAISNEGAVFGWGSNNQMQLSHIHEYSRVAEPLLAIYNPVRLSSLMDNNNTVINATGGGEFSMFVTKNKLNGETEVFACGHNLKGQLGSGFVRHVSDIVKIEGLSNFKIEVQGKSKDVEIVDLQCGLNHCMALTNVGAILEWGDNEYGQLGNKKRESTINSLWSQSECSCSILIMIGIEPRSSKPPLNRRGTIFFNTSQNKKGLAIRPESPKTREACLALGYDTNIFKLKTIEDFAAPGIEPKVQQMRFDHYALKTEAALKEISEWRRQIIKKNRQLVNLHLEKQFQKDKEIQDEMQETYNRKMQSLVVEQNDTSYLSFDDEDPILVLEQQLDKEIKKYHRQLAVKSKDVQNQLLSEQKRQELQKELDEREIKIKQMQFNLQVQKAQRKKKMQLQAQKKLKQIRDKEQSNNEALKEQKRIQNEKLEKLRLKLKDDELKRKQEIEEHERKEQQKQENVRKRKLLKDQEYDQQMTRTMSSLENKLRETGTKYMTMMQSRTQQLSLRLSMQMDKKEHIKVKTQLQQSQSVQNLINKMVTKEQEFKNLQFQKLQEEAEKLKLERVKLKKNSQQLKEVKSQQLKKVSELEGKFKSLELNSLKLKEQLETRKRLRYEKNKLKQQDLNENYQRQERLKDFRFKQLIKNTQFHNEQQQINKLTNELVKKAQQELQKRLKVNNETLDASILNITSGESTKNMRQEINNSSSMFNILEKNIKMYTNK